MVPRWSPDGPSQSPTTTGFPPTSTGGPRLPVHQQTVPPNQVTVPHINRWPPHINRRSPASKGCPFYINELFPHIKRLSTQINGQLPHIKRRSRSSISTGGPSTSMVGSSRSTCGSPHQITFPHFNGRSPNINRRFPRERDWPGEARPILRVIINCHFVSHG